MVLFDAFKEWVSFLARYTHVLFGITWIGLLYFFNFVQVPSFAEMEAAARSEALRKITKRALWWFRWAAAFTLATGVIMWGLAGDDYVPDTSTGLSITLGSILGITMAANVWMFIWPNQRINIASAESVAAGGEADPKAADSAKLAGRVSRVNAFFSIPMAFFMVFTSHFAPRFGGEGGAVGGAGWIVAIIFVVIWVFAEVNALGKFPGGLDSPFCVKILNDHKKVIIAGVVFTAIMYFIGWEAVIGGAS